MKIAALILVFWGISSSLAFGYDWSTNPGKGTPENPYQIWAAEHLLAIGSDYDLLGKYYILMNDIIFDPNNNPSHIFTNALISPTEPGVSMGFQGGFNGNGHVIKNLYIVGEDQDGRTNIQDAGLFGAICGGTVCNLNLSNVIIHNGKNIGSIAGTNAGLIERCSVECTLVGGLVVEDSSGTDTVGGIAGINEQYVEHCSVKGILSGNSAVGGITGTNNGYINHCLADCIFLGYSAIGGIAGANGGEPIYDCFAKCNITGINYLGGISGYNVSASPYYSHVSIFLCSAQGTIDGESYMGGVAGYMSEGYIHQSCSDMEIHTKADSKSVGGFVGYYGQKALVRSIADSYSSGRIVGVHGSEIGGLAGTGENALFLSCYSTFNVAGDSDVGGFVGRIIGSAGTGAFFLDTAGPVNGGPIYGIPKTQQEMKQRSTYAYWDFVGETANGTEDDWRMCEDDIDYPRLWWEFSKKGDFVCPNGIEINDLTAMAAQWLTSYSLNPDTSNSTYDANMDDKIDMEDFTILSQYWLGG